VAELPDEEEKARLASDPIYKLETGQASRARAEQNKSRMALLREQQSNKWDGPSAHQLNQALRGKLREGKRLVAQEQQVGEGAGAAGVGRCRSCWLLLEAAAHGPLCVMALGGGCMRPLILAAALLLV
jgi:hypothetical protein